MTGKEEVKLKCLEIMTSKYDFKDIDEFIKDAEKLYEWVRDKSFDNKKSVTELLNKIA